MSVERFMTAAMVGGLLFAVGCDGGGDGGTSSSGTSSGTPSGDSGAGTSGGGTSSGGTSSGTPSGETTFSCGQEGKFCVEYTGSATNIDTIRTATKCTDQGSVEGTGCTKTGAAICKLPANGSTGTSGAQYYYGEKSEDDLTALKTTCERTGGTFSPP